MNYFTYFYATAFLITPFFYCNGMKRFKKCPLTTKPFIFTKIAQPSLIFAPHCTTKEVPILANKSDSLLEEYNTKNNELHYAQNNVYEAHLNCQKAIEKVSELNLNNSNKTGFGFIALVTSVSLAAGLPLKESIFSAALGTSYMLLNPHILNALKFFKYNQKRKEALNEYKRLIAKYSELAQQLNKPSRYSLDNIDLNKYDPTQKIEHSLQCNQCNKQDDEIQDCNCSPKKIIKKTFTSYELIKKEYYLK
jgi:hypothetical protein